MGNTEGRNRLQGLSPTGRKALSSAAGLCDTGLRKDVALCCDCADFPCAFLAPVADQAAQYPHNMKLYNLCRIKKIGLDRWIAEEAKNIRKNYFSARFVVGKGQAD